MLDDDGDDADDDNDRCGGEVADAGLPASPGQRLQAGGSHSSVLARVHERHWCNTPQLVCVGLCPRVLEGFGTAASLWPVTLVEG